MRAHQPAVVLMWPRLTSLTPECTRAPSKKASPCGVATSLDIGLSNVSLKTVTLSFYSMFRSFASYRQSKPSASVDTNDALAAMCKSSSLGFVLLFAFLFHLERPTWKLCGIITIITVGVILMVSGETKFSLEGMITVLSASAMGGLRWALTQKLLDKEAMGLNNPFATVRKMTALAATKLPCVRVLTHTRTAFLAGAHYGRDLGSVQSPCRRAYRCFFTGQVLGRV